MGTKTVTLVPDAYRTSPTPTSVFGWKTYDGQSEIYTRTGRVWFRFPSSLIKSINGTVYVSGAISSGYYEILEDIYYYYSPLSTDDRSTKIGTLSAYPTSGSQSANFSTRSQNVETDHFYIYAECSQYMQSAVTSFRGTVTYDDLTIEEITPSTANVGDEVTVKFGNWFGEKITLTLAANNRTIATFDVSSSEGTYTFTCGTDWFTKAGATGNEFDITVTAVEDGALQRTAKSSFKLKREGIGTEITQQPISTGSDQKLKLKFNNKDPYIDGAYVIHDLHLLIEGAAKGSQNRVKLVPSGSASYVTVTSNTYEVTAADSWFNSINGSEMSVYITVTDAVDGRQDKLSPFTLKAGEALLPEISSIVLSSYMSQQEAEILEGAGYTGFVAGYSYVNIRVSTNHKGGSQLPTVIAKWSGKTFTLNYDGPDPQDDTRLIYSGTTDRKIASKSDALFTVTVTNAKQRSADKDAYIYANDITVLPNIGLVQQGTIYAGDSFYVSPTGCIGDYYFIIKTANYEITTSQWRSEPTKVLTTYVRYFQNSNQAGQPSINLNITITDRLGRSANFTFVMLAPLPQILSFAYVHVPDVRMPESASVQPTKADVVNGYSKINFTARVRWYCEPGSVVVKDQSNNANTLSLASNYSSTTFPKDADYSYTSDNVISTTYSQLIYTLTAKDTGVVTSGVYRRTGETLSSKITIAIYRLQNMTVTPPSTVDTDAQATIRVNNFVGSYAYEAKIANDTVSESEEPIITPTFSVFADPAWFESASTPTLTVYVTVEDVLGRTQTVSFTVRLNRFVLTLSPTSDIQIDGDIQISVEGSGSQQVAIVLTTPKGSETLELARTTATTTSPATVTCPQTWFTDHTEFDNVYQLPITVTASYAGRSTSQSFKLVYPDLTMEVNRMQTTPPWGLQYTFGNREGEHVDFGYFYGSSNTPIWDWTDVDRDSLNIGTPNLFDLTTPPVIDLKKIYVDAEISDKRGRKARIKNIEINAAASMGPSISEVRLTPINPDSMDSGPFEGKFIANISGFRITARLTPGSASPIDKAYAIYKGLRLEMTAIGDDLYKYDYTDPVMLAGSTSPDTPAAYTSFTLSFDVKDKRQMPQYTPIAGVAATVYYYNLPKAKFSYHRCNQDKTPNDAGTYCLVTCDYDFEGMWSRSGSTVSALNEGTVSVATTNYSDDEQLDFNEVLPVPSGTDPSKGTLEFLIPGMDMERTYDITITLSDLITSTTYTVRLSTAGVIMDFLRDGKGLALGKVAEHQGMVEVNPEWTFQAEKMKVRVKDGTDDKGLYDIGQLLCQILNRMNNGGL